MSHDELNELKDSFFFFTPKFKHQHKILLEPPQKSSDSKTLALIVWCPPLCHCAYLGQNANGDAGNTAGLALPINGCHGDSRHGTVQYCVWQFGTNNESWKAVLTNCVNQENEGGRKHRGKKDERAQIQNGL